MTVTHRHRHPRSGIATTAGKITQGRKDITPMKHPIPWYHAAIAATEQHLRDQERHLADVQASVDRARAYLAFYRT